MTETVVRYEPRGGALELMKCRSTEALVCGPAGTGKSLAMLYKLHLSCLSVPGLRALLVRQTHASLTGTTLVTFERSVVQDAMAAGIVTWFGGSARQPAGYRYANGSVILVGGLDRPEKFLSSEFDRIAIDEGTEVTEAALETLVSRLRGTALTYKQIVVACNPAHPQHWIKQRSDRGSMRMLHSYHRDNPAYVNADGTLTDAGQDYMGKLDALTGVRRLRLRDGLWAAAEGVIYEGFDPGVHVIDRFDIPQDWTRWMAIDFGFTNPFVAQWWTEDPDGRLYLYREIYHTGRTVAEHAATIMAQCSRPDPGYQHPPDQPRYAHHGRIRTEPKPRGVICDHDAENRAQLQRHLGMGTVAAKKAVKLGIEAVMGRLQLAGDGRPRLFIMRDTVVERDPALEEAKKPCSTAEEIPGYVWDIRPGKQPKEEPVKEDDHGADGLRYMVMHRERPGQVSFGGSAMARTRIA